MRAGPRVSLMCPTAFKTPEGENKLWLLFQLVKFISRKDERTCKDWFCDLKSKGFVFFLWHCLCTVVPVRPICWHEVGDTMATYVQPTTRGQSLYFNALWGVTTSIGSGEANHYCKRPINSGSRLEIEIGQEETTRDKLEVIEVSCTVWTKILSF